MTKRERCAVMNDKGRRCNSTVGTRMTHYHGSDLYSHFDQYPATWVTVPMCQKHDQFRKPKVTPPAARRQAGTR